MGATGTEGLVDLCWHRWTATYGNSMIHTMSCNLHQCSPPTSKEHVFFSSMSSSALFIFCKISLDPTWNSAERGNFRQADEIGFEMREDMVYLRHRRRWQLCVLTSFFFLVQIGSHLVNLSWSEHPLKSRLADVVMILLPLPPNVRLVCVYHYI